MKNNSVQKEKLNQNGKDTQGEATRPRVLRVKNWTKNNKRFVATIVACVAIVVMMLIQTAYMVSMIGTLSHELDYLIDTNSILESEIRGLESKLESSLEESNSMVSNYDITISKMDFSKSTYTVAIDLTLKEYTEYTNVGLYFGSELFMLDQEDDHFVGYAKLPISESYDGNITVLVINGDKKNTEIVRDYSGVTHLLEHVLSGRLEVFPTVKEGKLEMPGEVSADLNNNGCFTFSSLKLLVSANNQVVYERDYDKEPEDETSTEVGVEIPPSEEQKESAVIFGGSFAFTLPTVENLGPDTLVDIYLEATTKEGYVFRYVIFEGTTAKEKIMGEDSVIQDYQGWEKIDDYFPYTYSISDQNGNSYIMQ